MNRIVALVSVLFFLTPVLAQDHHNHQNHMDHEKHRVNVDVYYESLCPDSMKFIVSQLYVTLQNDNLTEFINLTLIPYGKSTYTESPFGSDYKFECHHGPAECRGNLLHACALTVINNGTNTEGLGYNKPAVSFISCLMSRTVNKQNDTVFPIEECCQINSIPEIDKIENCPNHHLAVEELIKYAKMTDAFQKPLKSVPTIVFEKQYKEEDNTLAQQNFVKALCKYIKGNKPNECNGASTIHLALFTLILALFYRLF